MNKTLSVHTKIMNLRYLHLRSSDRMFLCSAVEIETFARSKQAPRKFTNNQAFMSYPTTFRIKKKRKQLAMVRHS